MAGASQRHTPAPMVRVCVRVGLLRAVDPVRWGIPANPASQPFPWTSAYARPELAGCLRAPPPDSQEASRRKRPKYVIAKESPHVPLGTASAGPPGDGRSGTPCGGAEGLETYVFSRAKYPRGTAILAVVARALSPCPTRKTAKSVVRLNTYLGTTAAIPLPACLLRDQSLADVGEPQTFKTSYSPGVGGRFLVFHVKLFFKNGVFQSGLLQEFESKCRKTVCAAIPRWPQRC